MNKTIVFALLAATIAMPLMASATVGGCTSKGTPALGIIEISPTNSADATLYVDDRNYLLGNGIWLYQESNGIFIGGDAAKDLQRGGSSPYVPDDNEICVDNPAVTPDTVIF